MPKYRRAGTEVSRKICRLFIFIAAYAHNHVSLLFEQISLFKTSFAFQLVSSLRFCIYNNFIFTTFQIKWHKIQCFDILFLSGIFYLAAVYAILHTQINSENINHECYTALIPYKRSKVWLLPPRNEKKAKHEYCILWFLWKPNYIPSFPFHNTSYLILDLINITSSFTEF